MVLKSIIFDIGYLIKMMFTAEKLPFIIWMFLPVMFAPFFSKKLSTLILLLPIIPINLMQSWQYQYDIDFQYTYGVAAMIIFCSIIGIKDLRKRPRHIALLMSLIMCACMSANIMMPKITNNSIHNKTYGIHYSKIQNILDTIEEDASVTASHYIVPHLYFVDELYTVPDYYKALSQTDYYVIDTRYPDEEYEMREIMRNDYTLYSSYEFVEIYKHK